MYGVQKRDPAVDVRLMEFCFAIPEDQFRRDGEGRWLIRRAMADRLPPEILNNRRRGLQAANWLDSLIRARGQIESELGRLEKSPIASYILDVRRIRNLTKRIQNGRPDEQQTMLDYRNVLERGLTMGRFLLWAEG